MTILVVGDANADVSATLSRSPHEGDDSSINALAWGSGGMGVNVAAMLGRLGAPVRLLARVGTDPAAEIALRVAQAAGVDLGLLQFDAQLATGLCFAAVSPGGERTFFSYRGANAALELVAAGEGALDGVGWMHICGYSLLEGQQRTTTLALLGAAKQRGIPVSLDVCLPLIRAHAESTLAALPQLDLLFANHVELAALCEACPPDEPLAWLLEHGARTVVVKRGAHGCTVAEPHTRHDAPAFAVSAVDTNGCGDAFAAGFVFASFNNAPLPERIALANALGALTATRVGAAEALPTQAELELFLSRHQ